MFSALRPAALWPTDKPVKRMCAVAVRVSIITALLILPGTGIFAQETTATTDITTATLATTTTLADVSDTTAAAEITTNEDEAVNILLLGELVGLDIDAPNKEPFPDLGAITTRTLGGKVTDRTTAGLTLAEIAGQVESGVDETPDLILVFAGFSDERAETKDEDQRSALRRIVSVFRKLNENAQIFLIPSSTHVGAITSANMRLAANDENVTYVPIGTEVGGQPYIDAMEAVKNELVLISGQPQNTETVPKDAPANSVVIRGTKLEAPATGDNQLAPLAYEQRKANLQEELEQVAGQAGEALMTLPSLDDAGTTAFVDSTSTGTAGTVTKRGAEAKDASIKMKSLPAVKAFRPQIPVPRNEVNVKEPALSR